MDELERLKGLMPEAAYALGRMMVKEAIPMIEGLDVEAWPSVSITYRARNGGAVLRVTLSVSEEGDAEDD